MLCLSLNTAGSHDLLPPHDHPHRPKKIDLFVMNFDSIRREKINLQRIWNWLHGIEINYLIVIGMNSCLTAPTDLIISSTPSPSSSSCVITTESTTQSDEEKNYCQQKEEQEQEQEEVKTSFSLVEDLCLENGAGMTIYRNMKTLPSDWLTNRHGVSKRIVGGLIARRFVEK
jgi:hypothetical protein